MAIDKKIIISSKKCNDILRSGCEYPLVEINNINHCANCLIKMTDELYDILKVPEGNNIVEHAKKLMLEINL